MQIAEWLQRIQLQAILQPAEGSVKFWARLIKLIEQTSAGQNTQSSSSAESESLGEMRPIG